MAQEPTIRRILIVPRSVVWSLTTMDPLSLIIDGPVLDDHKDVGLMITKPLEPWARRDPILFVFESDAAGTLSRDSYHLESLTSFKSKFFCASLDEIKFATSFIGVGVMSDFYILSDFNRYRCACRLGCRAEG
jgi:hypothetical protein